MEVLPCAHSGHFPVELCVLSHNGSAVTEKFLNYFNENTDKTKCHLLWVDNGSSDDTKKILKSHWEGFDNLTVIFSKENKGVIGGRNIGFDHFIEDSDSDYLMFLDNDQYVQPGWLEQHLAVLASGYDLIGVEAWQMNRRFMPNKKNTRLSEWFAYVGCGGMLMKREVVEGVGKFDEQFNPCYFEDPDYNFRSHADGYKVGWNFKAKIVHEAHQTLGKSNDKIKNFVKSLERFRKKWKGHRLPYLVQKKLEAFDM